MTSTPLRLPARLGRSCLGVEQYSFSRFLAGGCAGLKVLEVGAAKTWPHSTSCRGCEYVTDVLDDDNIGIGRGAFFAERVGHYERVQADGEHLPFAGGAFDLTFCVATLTLRTRSTSRGWWPRWRA